MTEQPNNGSIRIPPWVGQAVLVILLGAVFTLAATVNSQGNRITAAETWEQSMQKQLDRMESKLDRLISGE